MVELAVSDDDEGEEKEKETGSQTANAGTDYQEMQGHRDKLEDVTRVTVRINFAQIFGAVGELEWYMKPQGQRRRRRRGIREDIFL